MKVSLIDIIYDTTKQFIASTSIGGLYTVADRKSKIQKFIWFAFFAGFLVKTVIDTIGVLDEYYEWPVVTRVELRSDGSVAFPSVSVCNLNPIDCTRLQEVKENSARLERLWNESECYLAGTVTGGKKRPPPPDWSTLINEARDEMDYTDDEDTDEDTNDIESLPGDNNDTKNHTDRSFENGNDTNSHDSTRDRTRDRKVSLPA